MPRAQPRREALAGHLLSAIVQETLRPGEPIDPAALARRHGVSRTVVREALADLGGKGLVRARPRIGTTVAPRDGWHLLDPALLEAIVAGPGTEDLRADAAALRRVVEPAIAADAAGDADRPARAAVLDAVRAIAGAVGANDPGAFVLADAALHAAIAAACRNRLLGAIDLALRPLRDAQRKQYAADAGGVGLRRALVLQTGLALAVVRGDRVAAAGWALELAGLSSATDLPAPTLAPIVRRDPATRGTAEPVPRPVRDPVPFDPRVADDPTAPLPASRPGNAGLDAVAPAIALAAAPTISPPWPDRAAPTASWH
jgi:DNA-binding FadR family transcriptional regulator